jgi:hypothetical protein
MLMPVPPTQDELDQQAASDLYAELEPQAKLAYIEYFSSHTPANLHDEMTALVNAGLPGPPAPDPTAATLHHGDSVRVVAAAGGDIPGSPGTVAITNAQVDFVQVSV